MTSLPGDSVLALNQSIYGSYFRSLSNLHSSFGNVVLASQLFFRVVKMTLSSCYKISGLVPVCWLLFQSF